MKYSTSDPLQRAKFLARASYLAEKGKDADLTELRPSAGRTASQNAVWWSWCSLMAETVGADPESVSRDVKRAVLGRRKVIDVLTGEETEDDYQTHRMTEDEMSAFLTKVKRWAQDVHGWWLPSRGDPGFDEMMMEYRKRQ